MNWLQLSIVFALSFVISVFLVPLAVRYGNKFNFLDHPGLHKRHKCPVPVTGGIALFVTLWITLGILSLLQTDLLTSLLDKIWYFFSASLIIFLVGLSDDLAPVSAWIKLLAQVAAGLILFVGGFEINPISIPFAGSFEIGIFSPFITILWVVGLSNAINLIDGLDGLASGVSLIASISIAVIAFVLFDFTVVVLALILIGYLLVFLKFNRYPAKIFLGDSGSLQLGFYFAVISLLVPIRTFTAAALYLPLLTLAVPILETVSSVFRRLASKKSITKADRRHLFHYLSLAGLSPRLIVAIFYAISFIFGLFSVGVLYLNRALVFSIMALFMVVISALFYILMSNLSRFRRKTDR